MVDLDLVFATSLHRTSPCTPWMSTLELVPKRYSQHTSQLTTFETLPFDSPGQVYKLYQCTYIFNDAHHIHSSLFLGVSISQN
jgi:hypothetical protein